MFKRKELKKASPGDFVVMGGGKISEIIEGDQYRNSGFNKGDHGRYISTHRLTKAGFPYNQLSPVDAGILYYKEDSVFGSGLVEVIPVVFLGENYDQTGMVKYFEQGRPFYVNKKDIDIMPMQRMIETASEIGSSRLIRSFDILVERGILSREDLESKIDDIVDGVRNR
tara:strand:- start:3722 stop:4228 length:507 start_codon:yes stop_codon:yes gene_type:complete